MTPDRDSPDRNSLDREKATAGSASDSIQERQIHGSLVEVRGLGVLILGPSGVGKSECVIELVRRGQRLVADDVVRLRTIPSDKPVSTSADRYGPRGFVSAAMAMSLRS